MKGTVAAAVEQRHRRLDLLVANSQLLRNLMMDLCHACLSHPVAPPNHRWRGRRLWTIPE
ncbi:hypothetical protein ACVWY2_008073 [Bradyrhizobium sp. JR6.1]